MSDVSSNITVSTQITKNCDGTKSTNTHVYNSETRKEMVYSDTDSDGTIDAINIVLKDENNNAVKSIFDNGADGTRDSISISTYDKDGNLQTVYNDVDADGNWDEYYSYFLDKNGNLVTTGEPNKVTDEMNKTLKALDWVIESQYNPE